MERTKIEQLFENYSFWRHLSEEEKKMLQEQIRWCTYEEGQMVTDTGRDCLGIFLVCDGILRANLVSEAGKEATVCRIHPGELCVISASCLLPALPFDIQIDAETASEVYLLPTGILRQIMEKNIYLENFIYKKINESFSDIIAAIQKILFASLEQRLVGFLLDEAAGEKDGKIYMTQEQIARAIGSAREAVSRTLKGLVKGGCVELFRGGVRVVDRKELYKKIETGVQTTTKLLEYDIPYMNSTLLYGIPGTGKTEFAKYVAYKLGMPYAYLNFSYLIESYLGKTAQNLHRIFDYCKGQKCVLMLDEIDCIGLARGDGSGADGELGRTTIALMQALDELVDGQVVIAATNREDRLDKALLRRFQRKVEFTPFNLRENASMIRTYMNDVNTNFLTEEVLDFAKEEHTQAEIVKFLIETIVEKVSEERGE